MRKKSWFKEILSELFDNEEQVELFLDGGAAYHLSEEEYSERERIENTYLFELSQLETTCLQETTTEEPTMPKNTNKNRGQLPCNNRRYGESSYNNRQPDYDCVRFFTVEEIQRKIQENRDRKIAEFKQKETDLKQTEVTERKKVCDEFIKSAAMLQSKMTKAEIELTAKVFSVGYETTQGFFCLPRAEKESSKKQSEPQPPEKKQESGGWFSWVPNLKPW